VLSTPTVFGNLPKINPESHALNPCSDVMEKPSWVDIAAGKTKVHTLEQDVRNYGRMVLSKTNISDHAITPYEVLIEAVMEQEGGEAASELSRQRLGAVSGWVHTLGSLGV
jgi:hypothetical protein